MSAKDYPPSVSTPLPQVRLTLDEQKKIISSILSFSNSFDILSIGIFGSRANINAQGGDIDLTVDLSPTLTQEQMQPLKRKMLQAIWDTLGKQKVDLVFYNSNQPQSYTSFIKIIIPQEIKIWIKNN